MSTRPFERLDLKLPEGWSPIEPSTSGATLEAREDGAEGFASSLVADIFHRNFQDGDLGALQEFHHGQVLSASSSMTDAYVIDDGAGEIGGQPCWGTTVAFRQGWWTVTALIRTVQAPGCAVVLVFLCDAERLLDVYPRFEEIVGSLTVSPSPDV